MEPTGLCCKLFASVWPQLTLATFQDAPIDATAGFVSRLTSTEQLLEALQSSLTARHNIAANARARIEAVPFPDQLIGRLHKHFEWLSLRCSEAAFSCCGQRAAVVLEAKQKCTLNRDEQKSLRLPTDIQTYELVLYSISQGWQQQTSFYTGSSAPVMKWGPSDPTLSVALLPRVRQYIGVEGEEYDCVHLASEHSAAFVYDADVDEELSAGCTLSESVRYMDKVESRHMIWSPDCQLLMLYAQWGGSPAEGCLELLDVAGDCMLAWSETLCGVGAWLIFVAAAWHPSSNAIILSHEMQLQESHAFKEAPPFTLSAMVQSSPLMVGIFWLFGTKRVKMSFLTGTLSCHPVLTG